MDTHIDIRALPSRRWAHPFDHQLPFESDTTGHDPSPEAIGGYYGVQWQMVFRDRKTGELYTVTCYDGVNRSKDAYNDEDGRWMQLMQDQIIDRTKREARSGATQIHLSREEWAVMSGRTFHDWLDLFEGEHHKRAADEQRSTLKDFVGTIKGTQVVVDPTLPNPLGDPPSDVKRALAADLARIDKAEDLAESLGY